MQSVNFFQKLARVQTAMRKFRSKGGRVGYLRRFSRDGDRREREEAYYRGFTARMAKIEAMIHTYGELKHTKKGARSAERQELRQEILDTWERLDKMIKWRIERYGLGFAARLRQMVGSPTAHLSDIIAKAAAPRPEDLDDLPDSVESPEEGGEDRLWRRKRFREGP